MMVVTHEMGFARKVADRVIFMDVAARSSRTAQGRVLRPRRSARAAGQGLPERSWPARSRAAPRVKPAARIARAMTRTPDLTITRPTTGTCTCATARRWRRCCRTRARQFARAIVMPNLKPPVTTAAQALAYRERILAALPAGCDFEPLMTLYLTDNTPPDEIAPRQRRPASSRVKLYPAGATTNCDAGVTDLRKTYATLEAMQRDGLPLLVHGEVTDPAVDVFDREAVFIDRVMRRCGATSRR